MKALYIVGVIVTILVSLVLGYYYELYTDYNKETGEYKLNWGSILGWLSTAVVMGYMRLNSTKNIDTMYFFKPKESVGEMEIEPIESKSDTSRASKTSAVPISKVGSTISASDHISINESKVESVSASEEASDSEIERASESEIESCITKKEWSDNYTRLT